MQRFLQGVTAALQGLRVVWRTPEVRRAYWFVALGMLTVSLLLNGAGFWSVFHFIPLDPAWNTWQLIGAWLLRVLGIVLTLLVTPLLTLFLCNLIFPLFAEIPFLAGLRVFHPARARELERIQGLPFLVGLGIGLRRFATFLLFTLGCLLLGWVPVVGAFIAFPLQLFVVARTLGWEMVEPYLDKQRLRWGEQRIYVRAHLPELLGFGLVCAGILAIPVLGPLSFGLLQAAAARLVVDVLERRG